MPEAGRSTSTRPVFGHTGCRLTGFGAVSSAPLTVFFTGTGLDSTDRSGAVAAAARAVRPSGTSAMDRINTATKPAIKDANHTRTRIPNPFKAR
ncbi:hypothetical protein GCM10009560_14280 [Nonomuraea longicatena]|uniref:Uncharacterized protein n=1 Tax=Nonomuraea longicatena TaxID=83682 RepID=A0ABN1NVU8_9ACTN